MATPICEIDGSAFGDPARFRVEIAERCEPVIARNLVSDWPVLRAAETSPQALRAYLGRFAEGSRVEIFVGAPEISGRYAYGERLEGFNFERRELDLLGALDHVLDSAAQPDSPSYYAGSLDTDRFLPGFSKENRVAAVPPTTSPRIWIGNASEVACHNDTFDNIAAVVAGRRRFTIYPPDAIADLYIGPIDHTMAGRPTSLAAASRSFDARYPRFEKARGQAMTAELGPGDAIYIPKLWWHQVEATAPFNILVNYWWDAFSQGPDAPYTSMMLAMIAIAERPAAERAAWRAYFDHYVFRPEGHPLAHLPEAQHGILGPVRSNYGRIRALVMQMLRGG
jgi:hypothetical protein